MSHPFVPRPRLNSIRIFSLLAHVGGNDQGKGIPPRGFINVPFSQIPVAGKTRGGLTSSLRMCGEYDKPAALDHVLYEMEMLRYALPRIRAASERGEKNCFMEAFAIHARNLNEFFQKPPEHKTKARKHKHPVMKPHHFISEWQYHLYKSDGNLFERASTQVAHLTYNRESPDEKTEWLFGEIFSGLREPMETFLPRIWEVDPFMAYDRNRARTKQLMDVLRDPPRASTVICALTGVTASPYSSSSSPFPVEPLHVRAPR
jgi:hypothetical protein